MQAWKAEENLSVLYILESLRENYKKLTMKKVFLLIAQSLLLTIFLTAQEKKVFTHADTLRGTITPQRAWWDVVKYDIAVRPDFESKTIQGNVIINFNAEKNGNQTMQIDNLILIIRFF